ncbi:hypothetical protein ROSEINA2194_02449 [Roseburia inulinivorans DSM 16841]|uniref:Uncharacterized protein n=1 Tax=Roseburia inulinivorans DSM 16841 TaxID=622312 RepID=C0FUM9_9FIRM|nr:hypothetical protein ROSEINA2194_02449 [Roseburia inulinivorans DSM 16841]
MIKSSFLYFMKAVFFFRCLHFYYDFFIKHNVFLCFVPIIIRFISVTQA